MIVNWNSRDALAACLQSLAPARKRVRLEVIVIDSGSFDGTKETLARAFRWARYIQASSNLGFARANNVAAEKAKGEYLLFLNPDTEIIADAVEVLVRTARGLPNAGVLGALLLNSDGTVQKSCVQAFPTLLNQLLDSEALRTWMPQSALWGTKALSMQSMAPQEVEAVSGACLLIKQALFREVEGFTEAYFMYAEDMDLSFKAKCRGASTYLVPSAQVRHHGGSSSESAGSAFAAVMGREAMCRYFRLNRGNASAIAYRFSMLVSAIARLSALSVASLVTRRRESVKASTRKWWAILRWCVRWDDTVARYYAQR